MALARRLLLIALLISPALQAASVRTEISGVDGELLANLRASLSLVRAERFEDLSLWRLRQMADDAREEARQALRPFGYYRPRIQVRLIEPDTEGEHWQANIEVNPGRAVTVTELRLEILGGGAEDPEFDEWQEEWPLPTGQVLDHRIWRSGLQSLERLAEARGYFDAHFDERRVIVDPDQREAEIRLKYDTGERYRFGHYEVSETPFGTRLMNRLHTLEADDPYDIEELDRQREVLVRSGLFERVVVEPERDTEQRRVNLHYQLRERPPNTWRSTVGFGTDTGARLQLGWTRHYLSSRGNRLDTAFGAQQRREEFVLRSEYQHPRGDRPSEFLTAGAVLRSEQDNFRFYDENRVEPVFEAFSGRREQAELTFGRLQERRLLTEHFQPLEERLFLSLLDESFDAFREGSFSSENEALLEANPELAPFLQTDTTAVALGARWRLPSIRGTGFNTRGLVLQAQLLGAHESIGSDVSFAQAWGSGRWHLRFGERHKLLLRGEIGYTEADTRRLDIELDDRILDLAITDLPERYRFKTGGDRTVRGYGYENLSTNRNGANHLLVGSVEYEFRVGENWSLAAFADIGNAFNDLDQRKLKRGVGVGFRWYTMIGPLQIDIAQALDDVDQPWRLHFTIGTQLL
ncbi:BamA/TamA family outer membrane protein [Wenzhouxiangella sp. XN201]|uniref:autotransporter assembly complex protein TamA n=1 Tax=Wenzhouxiangella sp. XN201 TaxID=2710755 RepID=UPI0013C8345E|nr:BamA/TamA family outer membrane protein [Wenzhouxiangella sp. XN201]NEZ04505.1 BamA/TamA family outer membrane protein [Wenzhouxiangella sp. XN201]